MARWTPFTDPWTEMNRLSREMDRLFGRLPRGNGHGEAHAPAAFPPLDLWQDADHLYVECELPGMDMNDLEIYVAGENQLTLKGERKAPAVEGGTWHRQERGYGAFNRTVELPESVDADKVEASFTQGVLTIVLPKREEAKPRRISVKAE